MDVCVCVYVCVCMCVCVCAWLCGCVVVCVGSEITTCTGRIPVSSNKTPVAHQQLQALCAAEEGSILAKIAATDMSHTHTAKDTFACTRVEQ